jgi:hypothetical protein
LLEQVAAAGRCEQRDAEDAEYGDMAAMDGNVSCDDRERPAESAGNHHRIE